MGFCMGAYLAGKSALDLMPSGIDVGSEILQDKAQVDDDRDTTIQVDWKFNASTSSPKWEKARWTYFQEGAAMLGFNHSDPGIIARYSANQNVAASVTPYGKGFVGLVGSHPEAYELWCKLSFRAKTAALLTVSQDEDAEIKNPEGIRTDIGYGFVKSTIDGIPASSNILGNSCF